MDTSVFTGCIPALMTPCTAQGEPDYDILVDTAQRLIAAGMRSVVYCGSMGDWPLLTDARRREGVARLVDAGVPVIVGTGAQNPRLAVAHAAHAQACGARGADGDSAGAVARDVAGGAAGAFRRHPRRRARPAGGDLQQPPLRLRNQGRPVLRPAARPSEPDRLQGIRRRGCAQLRRRAHHRPRSRPVAAGRRRYRGLSRLCPVRRDRGDHRHRQRAAAGDPAAGRAVRTGGGRRRHRPAAGPGAGRGAGRPVLLRRGTGPGALLQASDDGGRPCRLRPAFQRHGRVERKPAALCRSPACPVQGLARRLDERPGLRPACARSRFPYRGRADPHDRRGRFPTWEPALWPNGRRGLRPATPGCGARC